jgi:hypothetical protein
LVRCWASAGSGPVIAAPPANCKNLRRAIQSAPEVLLCNSIKSQGFAFDHPGDFRFESKCEGDVKRGHHNASPANGAMSSQFWSMLGRGFHLRRRSVR